MCCAPDEADVVTFFSARWSRPASVSVTECLLQRLPTTFVYLVVAGSILRVVCALSAHGNVARHWVRW